MLVADPSDETMCTLILELDLGYSQAVELAWYLEYFLFYSVGLN